MTSRSNARNTPQRDRNQEFDLVDDPDALDGGADDSDFGPALDSALPAAGGPGVDIDLDDFEAFNRELDAQLENARAPAREAVEDLGVEVVEAASRPAPEDEHDWDDTTEEPVVTAEPSDEEPALPEDRVTLTGRPAEMAATAAPATRRTRESAAPMHESTATAPPPSAPRPSDGIRTESRGGAIGVLLGLAGLAAGGAALWLTMERQAELERINATLAIRPAVVMPEPAPAPALDTGAIQALDARISAIRERIASLEARTAEAAQSAAPAEALDQRLAELEAEIAALQGASRAVPVVEPTPPVSESVVTDPSPQPAEPPQPAAAAVPTAADVEPAPPVQAPPRAERPVAVTTPQPAAAEGPPATPAAPAKAASRPLPMPGAGPWVVVIQSFTSEEAAEQRLAQVERTGLPAEVRWVRISDEIWHRVIVPGYESQESARAAAAELGRRKLGSPWVLLLNRPE